jgi:uncharacterized protein
MSIFQPLQDLADRVTYNLLSLEEGTKLADALNFFIYDSIKIILLLLAINFLMAIIRYYLPLEKIRDFLHKRKWYGADYVLAAIFGAITPFCSCSSIPLFIGFLGARIPIGVTFTFLITSPLINEAAVALFIGLFGIKLTIYYVLAAMSVGIIGGLVLSRINIEKHISPDILEMSRHVKTNGADYQTAAVKKRELLKLWWSEGLQLTKKLIPYVLVGIGIGAAIHGYVPQSFFENTLENGAWWTVPLATIVAVPLYSNAVGVIPIMQALVAKGVPIGTALAFMMATVGLSLPEALILKKAMSLRLLLAFFGVVATGIVFIGWIINILF